MLQFLEKLPNIYIVFGAFIILCALWFATRDNNVFTLANTALGAVIGLAMKTNKPAQQTLNTKNIENADISVTQDEP